MNVLDDSYRKFEPVETVFGDFADQGLMFDGSTVWTAGLDGSIEWPAGSGNWLRIGREIDPEQLRFLADRSSCLVCPPGEGQWYQCRRSCRHCGAGFVPRRRDARFCATRCRVAAARRRGGARSRNFDGSRLAPIEALPSGPDRNSAARSLGVRNPDAPVAALYVEPRGVYFDLGTWGLCDPWDARRDADTYQGAAPVVCHPPCGPWSRFRGLATRQKKEPALVAVKTVRRVGGVLEHPAASKLWEAAELPPPGAPPDQWGGRTWAVDQADWGHASSKPTWIYAVRTADPAFPPPRPRPRTVGKMHSRESSATPPRFAVWLIGLASTVDR